MLRLYKDTHVDNKCDIAQEFLTSVVTFQDAIKKSGISTWHDHIPELQMFFTLIIKFRFYINDPVVRKECLQESLQYYNSIEKYFLSNKDLPNATQIEYSLVNLWKMINLTIHNNDNLTRRLSKSEMNTMFPKYRGLILYRSKITPSKSTNTGIHSLEEIPVPSFLEPQTSKGKENFFNSLLRKCICR
jgi:hypothetical protein